MAPSSPPARPAGSVSRRTYVASHVELAYAQTSHATQGRTVDRSFLVLDGAADVRGIYVPMTRGRHSNEAFVVTQGEETATDVLGGCLARNWIDEPAVARRTTGESQPPARRRPGLLPPHHLCRLLQRRLDLARLLERPADPTPPSNPPPMPDSPVTVRTVTRADVETELADVQHRLADHVDVCTNIAKDIQPPVVTLLLGDRPTDGRAEAAWDRAAGLISQHHLAFGVRSGVTDEQRAEYEGARSASGGSISAAGNRLRAARRELDGYDRHLVDVEIDR